MPRSTASSTPESLSSMPLWSDAAGPARERCWLCRVRKLSMCAAARPQDQEVLRELKADDRFLTPGSDLFVQGEPCTEVFTVLDGWVMLYELLADGRRQILNFALPGAVLGFHRDPQAPMTYSAQALTRVRLCVVTADRLMPFLERHPAFALQLAGMIEQNEALAFQHLTSVGRRSARERLAHLLIELFCRVQLAQDSHGPSIPLPLTQAHLGDAVGLTPVHVNRTLRDLRQAGLVTIRQGRLQVLDFAGLAAVAGLEIAADPPCRSTSRPGG